MASQPDTTDEAITESGETTRRTLIEQFDPRSLSLRYHAGIVGLIALALVPFVGEQITMLKITGALYFAMFAMSWDAVSGYTGEISFGHALFFTVGGYTSALLNLHYGLDPLLTIPVGVVLAAVAGVLIGVPALRLHGPYLSLVTLVAPLILLQIFILYSGVFGGELGLASPDPLVTFDEYILVVVANYYVAFALFVAILAALLAVTRSDAGAVFTAIREDPDAVSAAGINVAKFKIFAFVLSGAVGGLAGAVFVHTPVGDPQPSQLLDLLVSIEVIIASILGGMGTIVGAAVGGLFFFLFSDYLGGVELALPLTDVTVGDANFLVFAIITLLILFYAPGGMLRWALTSGRRLTGRVEDDGAATDGGTTTLEQTLERYRSELRSLGNLGGSRDTKNAGNGGLDRRNVSSSESDPDGDRDSREEADQR